MMYNPQPQLITMEGEAGESSFMGENPLDVAELLGIEYGDATLLTETDTLSPRQVAYLTNKYPEYMGIWPIIAAAGKALIGAIPKGIKAIKKAVNKKKKKKVDVTTAKKKAEEEKKAAAAAVLAEKKRIEVEKLQKAEDQKKMMLTIGLPVAALVAIMLLKKR